MQFFTEHPFQSCYFKTIAPSQVTTANNKSNSLLLNNKDVQREEGRCPPSLLNCLKQGQQILKNECKVRGEGSIQLASSCWLSPAMFPLPLQTFLCSLSRKRGKEIRSTQQQQQDGGQCSSLSQFTGFHSSLHAFLFVC